MEKKSKYIKVLVIVCIISLTTNVFSQGTYNKATAIQYSETWWDGRNPSYHDYSNEGGDCAAFVSQCLIAGGLDLSKGTNGSGAGVKSDHVISGIEQLVAHLRKYQDVRYELVIGTITTPSFVIEGDPVFYGRTELEPYTHSLFCVAIDNNGTRLYNAHSSNRHQVSKGFYGTNYYYYHFHINSIPAHCKNCIWDEDEISTDCGGSCPPCDDAQQEKSITNTNSLADNNYALQNINITNATVATGRNVTFTAVDEITFGNGFVMESNSGMETLNTYDLDKITRNKSQKCDAKLYSYFTKSQPVFGDLVGYKAFSVKIHITNNSSQTPLIYQGGQSISTNGRVVFWDGYSGLPSYAQGLSAFLMKLTLIPNSGDIEEINFFIAKEYD